MLMKKVKEEKGSISVYVFIVLFSFLIVLTSFYISASTVRKSELATVLRIKQSYEQDNENIEEVYQRRLNLIKAGTVMKEKPSNWTSENVTAISDGNGGKIPLPSGFYYVGGDIKSGIIISDSSEDENKGESYEVAKTLKGNQFVWIPVSGEADLERTNFDSNGNPTTDEPQGTEFGVYGVSQCSEPYENGYSDGTGTQEIAEYNLMRTQVLKYGGFYIGRYEAGDADSKDESGNPVIRANASTAHTVICRKGVAPYTCIPWGTSMSDIGEISGQSGMVYLATHMYEDSSSVASTVCYGSQWDAMCRYIGDSQRTEKTKEKVELTGSVEGDESKNIYDLAGNCAEWTMEMGKTNSTRDGRISRGGYYINTKSISWRLVLFTDTSAPDRTFRPALYIK